MWSIIIIIRKETAMKKQLAWLLPAILAALPACSGSGSADSQDAGTDGDSYTDGDSDSDSDTDTGADADGEWLHPRAVLRADELPGVIARMSDEPYRTIYTAMKDYVDEDIDGLIAGEVTDVDYLLPSALVFLVEGDDVYLQAFSNLIDDQAASTEGRFPGQALAVAVDLMWDHITDNQKIGLWEILADPEREPFWAFTDQVYDFAADPSDDANFGYHASIGWNKVLLMGIAYAGYFGAGNPNPTDLMPEDIIAVVEEELSDSGNYWNIGRRVAGEAELNDALFVSYGGLYDNFGYDGRGEESCDILLNGFYSTGMGQDRLTGWHHDRARGAFYQQMWVPHTVSESPHGYNPGDTSHRMARTWYTGTDARGPNKMWAPLTARLYQDPYMQWWVNHGQRFDAYPHEAWACLLWYDDALDELPPSTHPTANLFNGAGIAVMREDWSDEAAFMMFLAGDKYHGGRRYDDATSFVLHRKTSLIVHTGRRIQSGDQGSIHSWYTRRSASRNAVLIFDPDEQYFPAGADRPYDLCDWEKLGGQISTQGSHQTLTDDSYDPYPCDEHVWEDGYIAGTGANGLAYQECADITRFEHRPGDYTYVLGAAAAAYSSKVDLVQREVVYVRPDVFVVYDRVNAALPGLRKQILLHLAHEPEVSGAVVDRDGHGYELYDGSGFVVRGRSLCDGLPGNPCSSDADCAYLQSCSGTGHTDMYVDVLLPEQALITKRGGFEMLVQGAALSPSNPLSDSEIDVTELDIARNLEVIAAGTDTEGSLTLSGLDGEGGPITEVVDLAGAAVMEFDGGKDDSGELDTGHITDTAKSWVPDQWQGYMVSCNRYSRTDPAVITGNSENTLYFDNPSCESHWSGYSIFKYKAASLVKFKTLTGAATSDLDMGSVDIRVMHCFDAESVKRVSDTDVEYTLHDFSTVDGQENFHWSPSLGYYIAGIEPAAPSEWSDFLTVISLRDPGESGPAATLLRADGVCGAMIEDGVSGRVFAVVFAAARGFPATAALTIPYSGEVELLFVGLEPSSSYDISTDGRVVTISREGGLISSDQGAIKTSATL